MPGVFLSATHTIVTPELYRLGELQTKSSFCLLPVNPIWLLAVTQLHYYLPTAYNSLDKVTEGESEISPLSAPMAEAGWEQLKGEWTESTEAAKTTIPPLNCFLAKCVMSKTTSYGLSMKTIVRNSELVLIVL